MARDRIIAVMAKIWSESEGSRLQRRRVVFVRVAGFTFRFDTFDQLRLCLNFYRRRLHPSRRSRAVAAALAAGQSRWCLERWYERLPLYLREEPKRRKVVAALEKAMCRELTAKS